jgi:hypothetical protein
MILGQRERVIALAHTQRVIPFLSALILPDPLPWAWVGGYLFPLFLAGTKYSHIFPQIENIFFSHILPQIG